MEKHIKLVENGCLFFGKLINIPDDVSMETLNEKFKNDDKNNYIEIIDNNTIADDEIIIDWMLINSEFIQDAEEN